MNDARKNLLESIDKTNSELFERIKNNPTPKPEELWQLSAERFVEWRKINDFPRLLKHFENRLLLFKEWKSDNGLTDEIILSTGKLTPFLEHKKLSKKKKLFVINQKSTDRETTFVTYEKLSGKKNQFGVDYEFEVITEFISYLDWLKQRNKNEVILNINRRQAPGFETEKVFIQSDFELLKMGGIKPPVNGFGILLKGKYLEFVNLCGLEWTGEINYGEFGSLDISYSACDNWIADGLKMALVDFEHCSIENFKISNSKIQQWRFYNCKLSGDFINSQFRLISIYGGLFSPVIKDCNLFNFDILKDKCLPDNNIYGYKTLKKIYADQGEENKSGEYYVLERDFYRKNSKGFNFVTKSISKFYWSYGKEPHRIIYFSIATIIAFSLIYFFSSNCISINIGPKQDLNFWDSLYFSVTAFTTLGFGDLSPIGELRIITTIEAFLGLLNMGFLISGFSNTKY
ncbi:MAG: potassium channel family protein [Marinifilaceae bacterium]|jgi:hypothetical protein|nr:potassium channel family protein [Marinifilaceae bacterium]